MSEQEAKEELARTICQYLVPGAYQKDTPLKAGYRLVPEITEKSYGRRYLNYLTKKYYSISGHMRNAHLISMKLRNAN